MFVFLFVMMICSKFFVFVAYGIDVVGSVKANVDVLFRGSLIVFFIFFVIEFMVIKCVEYSNKM